MSKLMVRTGLVGLVAVVALGLGGCKNTLKEENAALREENAKITQERDDVKTKWTQSEASRAELEGKVANKDGEIQRLQTELATKPIAPQPPAGGGGGGKPVNKTNERIVVAGDVLFSPGSASLTAGGKKEIDKVIATIKSKHAGDTIRVEGYTDSDPIKKSSYPSNKALSQARAESVEKYMASKGISASRISAIGMGSDNPKSSKAASRRVEIVIVDK